MNPRIGAVALLLVFFALERVLRQGGAANLRPQSSDRLSTPLLIVAYLLVGIGLSRDWMPGPALTPPLQTAGLSIGVFGLVLRVWAMRTLGPAYTRTLTIADGQRVVRRGPYSHIRHPGYLASLLVWTGAAVASGWIYNLVGTAILLAAAYAYRIKAEEQMLVAAFGSEYLSYQQRSNAIIPFLF